jgi:hypothetical protein
MTYNNKDNVLMDPLDQLMEALLPKSAAPSKQPYSGSTVGSGAPDLHKIIANNNAAFYQPISVAPTRLKTAVLLCSPKFQQWGFLEPLDLYTIAALMECGYQIYYLDTANQLRQFTRFADFAMHYDNIQPHSNNEAATLITLLDCDPNNFHILSTEDYEELQETLGSLTPYNLGRIAGFSLLQFYLNYRWNHYTQTLYPEFDFATSVNDRVIIEGCPMIHPPRGKKFLWLKSSNDWGKFSLDFADYPQLEYLIISNDLRSGTVPPLKNYQHLTRLKYLEIKSTDSAFHKVFERDIQPFIAQSQLKVLLLRLSGIRHLVLPRTLETFYLEIPYSDSAHTLALDPTACGLPLIPLTIEDTQAVFVRIKNETGTSKILIAKTSDMTKSKKFNLALELLRNCIAFTSEVRQLQGKYQHHLYHLRLTKEEKSPLRIEIPSSLVLKELFIYFDKITVESISLPGFIGYFFSKCPLVEKIYFISIRPSSFFYVARGAPQTWHLIAGKSKQLLALQTGSAAAADRTTTHASIAVSTDVRPTSLAGSANTTFKPNHSLEVQLQFGADNAIISPVDYILIFYDQFDIKSNEILFSPGTFNTPRRTDGPTIRGSILLHQAQSGTFPLACLTPHDANFKIEGSLPHGVKIDFTRLTFSIDVPQNQTEFRYSFQTDNTSTVPQEYKLIISPVPSSNPMLSFLDSVIPPRIKTEADQGKKLSDLIEFFRGFTDLSEANATELNQLSGIARLCQCIQFRKGACILRAQAFFLVATGLGFKTAWANSVMHAWVYIAYQHVSNGSIFWHKSDLGGSPATYVAQLPPGDQSTIIPAAMPPSVALANPSSTRSRRAIPLLPSSKPHYWTAMPSDAWRVYESVRQQLATPLFLYLTCPADITRYWQTVAIREGKASSCPGPLQAPTEPTTVLMNWTDFSDTELATYLSLLDPTPRLFGSDLPPLIQLRHLWCGPALDVLNQAFRSRFQPIQLLSSHLPTLPDIPAIPAVPLNSRTCSLYGLPNWRDALLGKLSFINNTFTHTPGLLHDAIKFNQAILVCDPPDDREFARLVEAVNYERRYYAQGQWFDASQANTNNVFIKTEKTSTPPPWQRLAITASLTDTAIPYYLNRQTFWNCLGNTRVLPEGNFSIAPGWIVDFPLDGVFVVTEELPSLTWAALIAEWQVHHPVRQLPCYFLPGLALPTEEAKTASSIRYCYNIHHSNDPMLLARLHGDKTIIIVSPEDTYSSLVDKVGITLQEGKPYFNYTRSTLLELIVATKQSIAFVGELSALTLHSLLPLLKTQPRFYNAQGEIQPLSGMVWWFAPTTQTLPVLPRSIIGYKYAYYHRCYQRFNRVMEIDSAYVKRMKQWFDFLQTIPHHGADMPPAPLVPSYAYWQRCYDARILSPPHHPFKSMLYDYHRGSDMYCFLNVALKVHFHDSYGSESFVRASVSHMEKGSWAWFNAHSAAALASVFSSLKQLMADVRWETTQPVLETAQKFIGKMAQDITPKPSNITTHLDKPQYQLTWFLRQSHWRIAFLKSDFGLGKTHVIRHSLDTARYTVYEDIIGWLTHGDKTRSPILLLDEANLRPNGAFDFLHGLAQFHTRLHYQGKLYPITSEHKVVATGNPEYYPHRHYHSILREAFVITLKPANQAFFMELCTAKKIPPEESQSLWKVYLCGDSWLAPLKQSIRDMKHLIDYYCALHDTEIGNNSLALAAFDCYAFRKPIADTAQLELFYLLLEVEGLPVLKEATPRTLFAMFKDSVTRYHQYGHGHLLLEGIAGVGKSFLLTTLCERQGLSPITLQGGQPGNMPTLNTAFKNGNRVIYDELNVLHDEARLNTLLSGANLDDGKPLPLTARMLATQNPAHYPGRIPLSTALRNRFLALYVPALKADDLLQHGKDIGLPEEQIASILHNWPSDLEFNFRDFNALIDAN